MDYTVLEQANNLIQKIRWYKSAIEDGTGDGNQFYIDTGHATLSDPAYKAIENIILKDLEEQLAVLEGQFDQL